MIGNTWSTIEVNLNNDLTWISVADQTYPLFFFSVFFVFNSTIIFFISFPQFIYDLFHISLTLISFTGTYEPTIDLLPTSVAL